MVCSLRSAVCGLQSAVCSLQSAICGLRSAVCSLRSAVCGLRSAVCGLQSAVCKFHTPHWESLLKQAIDHHAPLKRVNLKSNHLPWINRAIQKQMRIRNLLYKKFPRIPTNENWNKYRCQRNKVTALNRQSVKDFRFDAASVSSKCSPGLFWEKRRPLLPNSKSSVNKFNLFT